MVDPTTAGASAALPETLVDDLAALVGRAAVTDGDSHRALHAEDLSFHPAVLPDVVVFPACTADVSAVLAYASARGIPVTPFGAGSSLDVPVHGGISLDLTRMDAVLAIRPGEMTATVQAGVTRLALERRLGELGLFFPVDPGADATLGGMAATNAAGTMTVRHGKMRPHVLALEAVMADGSVIRTGTRAAKSSAGYDLTGLLVGSEGTLAVITELTLRVRGVAEAAATLRASFADTDAACAVVLDIVGVGLAVDRLELLDGWKVTALNRFGATSLPEEPLLLIEVSGSDASVLADLADVRAIVDEHGGRAVAEERDPTRRAELWRARHDLFFAEKAMAPGREEVSTDVCVPLEGLAGALVRTRAAIDRLGLLGGVSAHAGDGNIHAALLVDPGDLDEMRRLHALVEELADDAIALGGTCSGEHGIGLGKREALGREHAELLPLMRAIKRVWDPAGVLNPGKVGS